MHTVELLDQALEVAGRLGYELRQEWLDGKGGGSCECKGHKWLFLDLAHGPDEHLEVVTEVLRNHPGLAMLDIPYPLRTLLGVRKSA